MHWLQGFLIQRGEKKLYPCRTQAGEFQKQVAREYEQHLPLLKSCYEQAGYWHGTGRYHYCRDTDARYRDVAAKEYIDVLNSILECKGLRGHQDLWVKVDSQEHKTVSIGPSRMHSRLYAEINQNEHDALEYVIGDTKFWLHLILPVAIIELATNLSQINLSIIRQITTPKFFTHLGTWAHSVRNEKPRTNNLWRAHEWRSDIPGNHGILFGIKREDVDQGLMPFFTKFEKRVVGPIGLERFTHIEVPRKHVIAVRELLERRGVELPVIPIEFGELYVSQRPLGELVFAE